MPLSSLSKHLLIVIISGISCWNREKPSRNHVILNLLGMGLGPLVVGWLSDVYGDLGEVSIRYALLSSLVFCAVGAVAFARAGNPYARAMERSVIT